MPFLYCFCSPLKELIFAYVYFNYDHDVLLCFYWFVGVCYYLHDKVNETNHGDICVNLKLELGIFCESQILKKNQSVLLLWYHQSYEQFLWTVWELKFSSKVFTFHWPLLVTQSWILLLWENAKGILIKIMDLVCCMCTKHHQLQWFN